VQVVGVSIQYRPAGQRSARERGSGEVRTEDACSGCRTEMASGERAWGVVSWDGSRRLARRGSVAGEVTVVCSEREEGEKERQQLASNGRIASGLVRPSAASQGLIYTSLRAGQACL
jgi:hypothetical protein